MKKAIIDTTIWIGHYSKNDQWKTLSQTIIQAFLNRKISKVYITDYVVVETINFLIIKEDYDTAKTALDAFNAPRVEIRHTDPLLFSKTQKLFHTYQGLSLTDASLVALAEELNINILFSFDKLFDRVKGIQRLESFSE